MCIENLSNFGSFVAVFVIFSLRYVQKHKISAFGEEFDESENAVIIAFSSCFVCIV